jgi:hypothetical protein
MDFFKHSAALRLQSKKFIWLQLHMHERATTTTSLLAMLKASCKPWLGCRRVEKKVWCAASLHTTQQMLDIVQSLTSLLGRAYTTVEHSLRARSSKSQGLC